MSDTASRLLETRTAEGRSRDYIARLLDPPPTAKTIERWEKGITPVPRWRLRQLAEVYGVPLEMLENGVTA
jgi:transcriptional regulator with XRE-family HTH domain